MISFVFYGDAMFYKLPKELTKELEKVRSVGVITGAGISVESGIPPYRGKGGVYDDPKEGEKTIEAVSGSTLITDPDRTWRAIAKMAGHAKGAKPNAAHMALVDIEERADRFVLLTQNVDGLHQAAGSRNVIDIHGTLSEIFCMSCGKSGQIEDISLVEKAPKCSCGGVLRPNVVLFEEMLPQDKLTRIYQEFYAQCPDLILIIGTSAMFPYIVEPALVAHDNGKLVVEVNLELTALSHNVDFSLRDSAGVILPLIAKSLFK